jgi:carboxypeptidase Taq
MAMNNKKMMAELKERLTGIAHLHSSMALHHWDQEVYMPKGGDVGRARTLAHLAGVSHDTFLALDNDKLLTKLYKLADQGKIKGTDAIIIKNTHRDYLKACKLPSSFVKTLTETAARSQGVWAIARQKNDFKLFKPWLEKMVKLKREEAKLLGYKDTPYDALLDSYEPGNAYLGDDPCFKRSKRVSRAFLG